MPYTSQHNIRADKVDNLRKVKRAAELENKRLWSREVKCAAELESKRLWSREVKCAAELKSKRLWSRGS